MKKRSEHYTPTTCFYSDDRYTGHMKNGLSAETQLLIYNMETTNMHLKKQEEFVIYLRLTLIMRDQYSGTIILFNNLLYKICKHIFMNK